MLFIPLPIVPAHLKRYEQFSKTLCVYRKKLPMGDGCLISTARYARIAANPQVSFEHLAIYGRSIIILLLASDYGTRSVFPPLPYPYYLVTVDTDTQ